MFKNLFIKSKKIISLFTIIGAMSALTYVLSQDNIIKTVSPSNDFPVENVKEIEKEENKIITKEYINYLTKDFNKKLDKDNKDITILTMDSTTTLKHSKDVKGIIDNIVKKSNQYINSFYLPFEDKKDGLKEIEYINFISNNIKNKVIFVNQSFINYIELDNDFLTFDSLEKFNNKIKEFNNSNNELLELLKNNPNIALHKSAGNYLDSNHLNNKKELIKILNIFTNNNFQEIQGLVNSLNKIIINRIYNNNNNNDKMELNKDEKELLQILPKICNKLKINYDYFISLYIQDYLIHYERINLLEKLNTKENKEIFNELNNPFKLQQITIIEAIDLNIIKDNIEIFKEYHKDINISHLENEIKNLNISNHTNYSLEDINKLEALYNSYKEEYKEIFYFSKYGSLSNLMYKESNVLKTSIDGQNASGLNSSNGTSFASPNYLGNYVIKYIENHKNNIKDMFFNYYDKINLKIKSLDE